MSERPWFVQRQNSTGAELCGAAKREVQRHHTWLMELVIKKKTEDLPVEGEVEAKTGSLKEKSDTKLIMPFTFTQNGKEYTAVKEYTKKALEPKDELFRDAQAILNRPFNEKEQNGTFDTSLLENQPCRIVVINKRTAGGKRVPVVTTVLRQKEAGK